jgi:hypothetical protein
MADFDAEKRPRTKTPVWAVATPRFRALAAPKTFRGVTPARVGTMNRAMCFVMRLVVGP